MESKTYTFKQLQNLKDPFFDTEKELMDFINNLLNQKHDYNTSGIAMSVAASAMFNYVGHKLGCTGFQAGYAQLDFIRRQRGLKMVRLQNIENLLYPQYCNEAHFPSCSTLMFQNRSFLKKEAKKLLRQRGACASVKEHWKKLATM